MRCGIGVVGCNVQNMRVLRCFFYVSRIALERAVLESDNLVCESVKKIIIMLPSMIEHVECCDNLTRPWRKAKY